MARPGDVKGWRRCEIEGKCLKIDSNFLFDRFCPFQIDFLRNLEIVAWREAISQKMHLEGCVSFGSFLASDASKKYSGNFIWERL